MLSLNFPLGAAIIGAAGIVFSVKQNKIQKTGFAKAGLILGIIGVVLSIASFVAILFLYNAQASLV